MSELEGCEEQSVWSEWSRDVTKNGMAGEECARLGEAGRASAAQGQDLKSSRWGDLYVDGTSGASSSGERPFERFAMPQSSTVAKRRPVLVTERDFALLPIIAAQCTITQGQLAHLLGRSEHTARSLRARWQRAGWIESRVLIVGLPAFIWLTPAGQRVCGVDWKPWRPSALGRLPHLVACTDARLMVSQRRPEAVWTSERELLRAARINDAPRRRHIPDAEVAIGDHTVAIEVELTPKERRRTELIVLDLLARYDAVWYFAVGAARRQLEEIARKPHFHGLQVLALDDQGR